MHKLRRDNIPFIVSCLVFVSWSFSSFMSVDMINLYSYFFMHDRNYPALYYTVFSLSMISFMFLKFNKVFTAFVLVHFNFFIHLLFVIFIYFPLKNRTFFDILFGLWSHLYALNVISTFYISSNSMGGTTGVMFGASFAYHFGYLLYHGVLCPSDYSIKSRRRTCHWFFWVRFLFSILSFWLYRFYLNTYFTYEYIDATTNIPIGDLFKWVDGKKIDLMSSVRIGELMPSTVDFNCAIDILTNNGECLLNLIILSFCFSSSSVFSPSLAPTPLLLSIYKREHVYFVEFLGGFLGCIIGVTYGFVLKWFLIFFLFVHYILSWILYFSFNTKVWNLYKLHYSKYLIAFASNCLGSFLLLYCFRRFFHLALKEKCKNRDIMREKPNHFPCCENDTRICICNKKNLNENCADGGADTKKCICIWVPANNHQTYRDWEYCDCIFCLSQNYSNQHAKCTCCAGGQHSCCACCCPDCTPKPTCSCSSDCNSQCNGACCCKKEDICHYLLRNCVVSCCPYCDYCFFFECVKINCVCPCSHKGHKSRNEDIVEKEKCCLTRIKLNLNNNSKHIYLCTYAETPDTKELKKFFCCKQNCSTENCCCIKCCCESKNICGTHFDFADFKMSNCCHYDLKIWISLKELNSTFHIGQPPFPDKYSYINSFIFTNKSCRDCCEKCSCCVGSTCKKVDVLKVKGVPGLSQSGGYLKLECKNSGSCKCCCCCCQGSGSQCECCCGCKKSESCSCNGKKCCAIKIVPTNLPFQYKKFDIKRSEAVSLVCISMIILCFLKVIVLTMMAAKSSRDYINLTLKIKHLTNVNGVNVYNFNSGDYSSDVEYAKQLVPGFEGSDEYRIGYAIDIEIERLEKKTKLVKAFMDELNTLRLEQWLQEITLRPKKVLKGYSRLRLYKHLNAFLEYSIVQYSFKTADLIYTYFKDFNEKWAMEWLDFEKRFMETVNIYTKYSLSLNSLGYFDTNSEFQRLVDNQQMKIKRGLHERSNQLIRDMRKGKDLLEALRNCPGHERLPRFIDVWAFRLTLMERWSGDRTLYLNWTLFMYSMNRILEWNELFRDIYMDAFKKHYGSEKDKGHQTKVEVS